MAPLPRPTVMPSMISAMSTNTVISRAVKNSPIAEAATKAMVMDNSMVIRPLNRSANASLKMGNPPIRIPVSARKSTPWKRGTTREPNQHDHQGNETYPQPLAPVFFVFISFLVMIRTAWKIGDRRRGQFSHCSRTRV